MSLSSLGTWIKQRISIYKTKVIFLQVCFDLNHQRNGCCSFFSFLKIKYVLKFFYMRTRRRKLCTDGRELYYLYRWNVLRIKRRNLLYCFSFVYCFNGNFDKKKDQGRVWGVWLIITTIKMQLLSYMIV